MNAKKLQPYIETEIRRADELFEQANAAEAFYHLERAHVLGQSITYQHTKVHWRMLRIAWARRDLREIFGQLLRIVGAATKTPLGIYPKGNTGGANVWFFKPMPVPEDLRAILESVELKS